MENKEIVQLFRAKKVRATPQRVEIYKYLREVRSHPDADEIYQKMIEINPSFSKTTVYNALQALEKNGLIIKIKIDKERVRYDACVIMHGHFMCEKCNRIYDFSINDIQCVGIEGFDVTKQDVYYSGICPECK